MDAPTLRDMAVPKRVLSIWVVLWMIDLAPHRVGWGPDTIG